MKSKLKSKLKSTSKIKIGVLGIFLSLFAFSTFANDQNDIYDHIDIRLGMPAYGGNGCPAGSASALLSPDRHSFKIMFDQYVSYAGGESQVKIDRKSCNISIPVIVPEGYSIAIANIDEIKGFTEIPLGGEGRFNLEYFFAGARGPVYSKRWIGPRSDSYVIMNTISNNALTWSPCGQSVNLRINSSILSKTNSNLEATNVTVDDGFSGNIIWKVCR
ncbi:MAG: DUF4360 domain-containing protein [Oligoflexia bacterium]|nr:DUF4360 domain-containing protein [Oligoflexia bacterium]